MGKIIQQKPRAMTPRHMAFVEHYLKSGNGQAAAIAAGYAKSSAHARAHELLHSNKAVMAMVEKARQAVARKGEFTLERLMEELNDGATFARETGNATALARFTELKAKAMGLLIERIDQRQVGSFEINITGIDKPKAPEPIDITPNTDDDIFK